MGIGRVVHDSLTGLWSCRRPEYDSENRSFRFQ